jgi:hypothetical protein
MELDERVDAEDEESKLSIVVNPNPFQSSAHKMAHKGKVEIGLYALYERKKT